MLLLTDPLTGAELGEADKAAVDPITVNNRLRGVLRGALGGLTLLSPDAGRAPRGRRRGVQDPRCGAAAAAGEGRGARSPTPASARGWTGRWRRRAHRRRPTAEQRIGRRRRSRRLRRPRRALAAGAASPRRDADAGGPRRRAPRRSTTVEQRLALWGVLGNVFQGVSLGSVLLLAAVGLAITFGVMGVINMAHGEMVMLGAYTTFVVQELFRTYAPGAFDLSLLVAIPAAFLVTALVGIAIERGIIRFLYGRPLETLLATWGLSLILQQAVRTIFGPSNREVGNPVVDERRARPGRRADADLQPHLDHRLQPRRLRRC